MAQKFSKSAVLGPEGPAQSDFSHQQRNEQRVIFFLRGIYVAFFGCKSECADLAKNRSGILMLRFGLLIRAGNRHGFQYGWGTK
ncbi:MAG TPA: hypothetical protein K8V27_06980, partial [Butyricicoccus pullicaecorum]|nr:hypothetical protein [Butyricicoccus pullicaecorum]